MIKSIINSEDDKNGKSENHLKETKDADEVETVILHITEISAEQDESDNDN